MEDKTNFNVELITRCLEGSASDSDRQELLKWINMSHENESFYFTIKDIYEAGSYDQLSAEADTHKEWFKFKELTGKEPIQKKVRIWKLHINNILKYAAILVIGIFSTFLVQKILKSTGANKEFVWQTIISKNGMQTDFELPDGSHIWLNSASSLQFPRTFSEDIREVKLRGEAFFNVRHDKDRPFIVNTGKMNVEVLGTTFNVTDYAGDNMMDVELESGKVNLFTGEWKARTNIGELKPGQRAIYDQNKNAVSISDVEIDKYVAWKNGMLIFSEDSMEDVLKKLGRWFNVDFIIQDQKLKEYEFTATFKGESLIQVLDLLKLSSPIDYRIQNASRLANGEFSKTIIYLQLRR